MLAAPRVWSGCDGVLFDLGVSSLQLDEAERGFAYAQDAPLDMRMDRTQGQTAAEVLNTYPAEDLARILRAYGEERFARRIADRVVREREREPFTTSARLADLVRDAIPAATRRTGGNPSKRTFQALRIEVNGELDVLARAIPAALGGPRGRGPGGGPVATTPSRTGSSSRRWPSAPPPVAPPDLPVVPVHLQPWLRLLTRGAETASDAEIAENPRAASVRLRAAERVRDAA